MGEAVLVTGAFGLVGSATVKRLAADGRRVVATDLDIPANRKAADKLPPGVEVRYADLTDPAAVDALIADVAPSAVIHLAAIIPPFIYMRRDTGREGQRRRHRRAGRGGGEATEPAPVRAGLQHRGLRGAQPAHTHRRADRRHPDQSGRRLRRAQGGGREAGPRLVAGLGDPAPRRRADRRPRLRT